MRRALFLWLCMAGCFSKPDFTGSDPGIRDANGDGAGDGVTEDAPINCSIDERFDPPDTLGCGMWGSLESQGSPTAVRSSGRIRITAETGEVGYCETSSTHGIGGGVTLDVPTINTGGMPGDEVFLEVNTSAGWLRLQHTQRMPDTALVQTLELMIGTGGFLEATTTYSATSMRLWKMTAISDNQIEVSVASEGGPWQTLDIVFVTGASAPTRVRFGARGAADTGDFEVESFRVCP